MLSELFSGSGAWTPLAKIPGSAHVNCLSMMKDGIDLQSALLMVGTIWDP